MRICHSRPRCLTDSLAVIEEDTEIDLTKQGWSAACPPSSALGQYDRRRPAAVSLTPSTALDHKTFISNHSSFMDLCDHPEHVALHGFLSGRNPTVQPLSPIFSLAKTSLHSDILGVPTEQWSDNISTPHWYGRPEEKLLWRGSNTGTYYDISTPWRTSHRARLLRLANQISQDEEDEEWGVTLLPAPKLMRGETLERMTEVLPWGRANRHYMDVAFTGTPIRTFFFADIRYRSGSDGTQSVMMMTGRATNYGKISAGRR